MLYLNIIMFIQEKRIKKRKHINGGPKASFRMEGLIKGKKKGEKRRLSRLLINIVK